MGILDRTSTILRANINALLDHAEDPEQMLDQIIRDMAAAIAEAKGQVAEVIAQEKLLESDYEQNTRLATEWGQKAELAVRRGADDLAKEALRRKLDYDHNAQTYGAQLEAQRALVTKLTSDLEQLENKYDDVVRNRDMLIARHKRAVAEQRIAQTAAQLSAIDPSSQLGHMEERIRLEEARASAAQEIAGSTTENRFAALEQDDDVDRQLADLRAKVQGQLPAPTA